MDVTVYPHDILEYATNYHKPLSQLCEQADLLPMPKLLYKRVPETAKNKVAQNYNSEFLCAMLKLKDE